MPYGFHANHRRQGFQRNSFPSFKSSASVEGALTFSIGASISANQLQTGIGRAQFDDGIQERWHWIVPLLHLWQTSILSITGEKAAEGDSCRAKEADTVSIQHLPLAHHLYSSQLVGRDLTLHLMSSAMNNAYWILQLLSKVTSFRLSNLTHACFYKMDISLLWIVGLFPISHTALISQ